MHQFINPIFKQSIWLNVFSNASHLIDRALKLVIGRWRMLPLLLAVFLTACGGGGSSSSSDGNNTPTPTDTTPTITISSNLTFTEDFAGVIQIATATNAISLTVTQSTAGVVTVTNTNSVAGVSIASILNANGQTTLTITATNGRFSATSQVVVQITPVDDPPMLNVTTTNLVVDENFTGTHTLATASDVEGDPITFRVIQSTTGIVTVMTSAAGVALSSIPNVIGRTTLTISVMSGLLISTAQVTVQVMAVTGVNNTPTLTLSSAAFTFNEDFATATIATAMSLGQDILTITVSQSDTGVVTVTTSATSVRVSSIPNVSGQTTLTISASNGRLITTAQVSVRVMAVNDPPTLTISTSNVLLLGQGAIEIRTTATDIENDALSFTATASTPAQVSVAQSTNGFLVTNLAQANGITTVTITVSDGRLSTSLFLRVRSEAGPTLQLTSQSISAISGFAPIMIGVTATDLTDGTLTFLVQDANQDVVNFGTTTNSIVITSIRNAMGQTTLTVSVTDNAGITVSRDIVISVRISTSTLPTLAVSTNLVRVQEDFMMPVIIGTTATDLEDGTLTFTVRSSVGIVNPVWTTHTITLTALLNANGTETLTIEATDTGGQSVSTQIVVVVNAVNDPPNLTVSSNQITTGGNFLPITIGTTVTDDQDSTVSFVVTQSADLISVSTSVNAIVLNSRLNRSGRTTLTVVARDSGGLTATQTIVINVTIGQGTPPLLSISAAVISLQEDFDSTLTIGTTATDAEDGTLRTTVTQSRNIVNVTITTHTISLTAIGNANGTTTLTVQAQDSDSQTARTQILVVVSAVNDPPSLSVSTSNVALTVMPIEVDIVLSDPEDSTLPISVSTGQGAVGTVITTSRLSLSRLNVDSGQVILTLRTTDSGGLSASATVTVMLQPAFRITTGIKTLEFSWGAIPGASHYQLRSNPDRTSGFIDLSTNGIVVSPNSNNISRTTAQAWVSLHRYIPRVSNPQYGVNTCHSASCGASFTHNTVGLTNAYLLSMVGRLEAANPDVDDNFGQSMSISADGNTLVVGAPDEDGSSTGVNAAENDGATNAGAAYVFQRNGATWLQQAYIKASNTDSEDSFGIDVGLSADGNTLAVSAPREDGINNVSSASGAVYVFRRSGGVWVQQAYIKALNAEIGDFFGGGVNLSANGNTLIVGAPFEDGASTRINGADDSTSMESGAAYVFRFNSGAWAQQAYIKPLNNGRGHAFGGAVGISADGNTIAVGAFVENGASKGVNGVIVGSSTASGAAYIFRFNSGAWTQQAYIKAHNTGAGDQFGRPLSLSADGNTLAVSAALEGSASTGVNGVDMGSSTASGATYVFRFSSNVWSQQAYIKAFNTGANDSFGRAVSLSGDGNTLAVGASNENGSSTGINTVDSGLGAQSGAAYVFEFSNGIWLQKAYIKPNDLNVIDEFGQTVALNHDGATLAVGARGTQIDQRQDLTQAAVYLY